LRTRLITNSQLHTLATALSLFLLFAALFTFVQFGTDALAGNDGYYHIKMGWLIRQQGLKPDFPWLPQTILNADAYYDHHLLYHVYLALFAAVDPAVDGGAALTHSAKIASIVMPSLAFVALWWLLRGQQVRWPALWALALFMVSEAFLYRMSMPRAQSASLLVLALGLHWLFKEKFWLLIPLGFLYVWLYNAFPLLLVLGGVYLVATLLTERRLVWQAVVFPGIGIGLGILVNPYFPENISFIVSHLLPKIGDSATKVGNEWYPYQTATLLENSGGALAAFALGVLAVGWQKTRINRATLTALVLALLFGLMLFQSRRFVEYFPAFALIFAALSVSPIWEEWETWLAEKRPFLTYLLPVTFLLLLLLPLNQTLRDARSSLADAKPADQYAAAALWLREEAPAGAKIFQTDWDDFTRLFFYNTDAIYTAGLDPTYMELYDADLFETWVAITKGKIENPSTLIREQFAGEYVFSDLGHEDFIKQAEADPNLEEIYRDDDAVIFVLK
ncbi:MAG: hypothetical protein IAF02_26200, partial [Anaerolineae bacterium]|nr:hypothetical protein [Anaerolineae bacterium]